MANFNDLTKANALSLEKAAAEYQKRGFAITPLRPNSKAAYETDWNTPGYTCAVDHWEYFPADNIGVILEPSGLCTLDIDNKEEFLMAVEAVRSQLPDTGGNVFWKSGTAGIKSGKPNKGKLVFRLPEGVKLTYHKLLWGGLTSDGIKKHTVFELRCGFVQDVLPPSIHPDTEKPYQWIGENIEPLPDDLLALWSDWERFEPIMIRADRLYNEEPAKQPRGRPRTTPCRDLIDEWNQQQDLEGMLQRYGYRKAGDRFISPNSTSGSPGIILSKDGSRFYSFHQSDIFADGHQHSAFDLMMQHEHQGNFGAALEQVKDDLGITRIRDADLVNTIKNLIGSKQ